MQVRHSIILITGIFLLGFACSEEQTPKEISASVTNYLSLFPEQTNILMYSNFEALKQSPFGQALKAEFEEKIKEDHDDEEYRDFVEKTGLDVKKDIYEIWLGAEAQNGHDKEKNGGAIVRGKFDRKRLVDYFKKEHPDKFREETYREFEIYIIKQKHDEELSFSFLNSETMALGSYFWLKTIIRQSQNQGAANVLSNPTMAKFIHDIPHKEHLWGVLNINELTDKWSEEIRKRSSGFKGTESLENMQSLIFYSQIDEKANLFIKGNFTTEEEAQLLAEMLTGFKALAKLMVSDDKEAVDMLNDIKIKTKGSVVNITAKVDKDIFKKVEQKRKNIKNKKIEIL